MNEVQMRCFICLAETLNFTQTAARLFMTQQAASKHISQLEEELGFLLLIRSKHGVTLTPEGKRCYMLFTDFIRNYDEMRANILNQASALRTIHIGFQNWLDYGDSQHSILAALRKQMPDLEVLVEVYSPGRLNRLLEQKLLDVVLMQKRFVLSQAGLKSEKLSSCPMILFCSAALDMDGEKLRSLPLIIDAYESEEPERTLLRAHAEAKRCGLSPAAMIIMPNRDSVYGAVEEGKGITTGTTISQAVQNPRLRVVPTDARDWLLCLWKEDNPSHAIPTYVKIARQEYREMRPKDPIE